MHCHSSQCISDSEIKNPFAVSYLTNAFGFTPESALAASSFLRFKSPEKPESVTNLLKTYGFKQDDITKLVKRYPQVLGYSLERISSKIEFLISKGASSRDVVAILARNPNILRRRLDSHVIPIYNLIKELLHSDEKAIAVMKDGKNNLFSYASVSDIAVSIDCLRDNGVSQSNIADLLLRRPQLLGNCGRLKQTVEELKEMGFDPSKKNFVWAVIVKCRQGDSKWRKKIDVYKSWGWTEEEIFGMFKLYPMCLGTSERKISLVMNFVVNKLGWGLSVFPAYASIIALSFEKRIIPRDSVLQSLLSKGLIEKKSYVPKVFMLTDKVFLDRYVNCYECANELLKLYRKER
ncbi:hypothetical protein Tsubulata_018291 [Turnera subulata]|uniref:Uncharacterized protein n=1 Tax=Turnera subulata TaxID=218843 RepID=A0A9Q0G7M4_9ROSI|nr:hypothetical protein Tsubulata_018291 [Turnera subulata]